MSDIYILASGPSVTYVDPAFFDGKRVISVNRAADRLGIYGTAKVSAHTHYHADAVYLADKYRDSTVYAPEGDQGFAGSPLAVNYRPNIVFYTHPPTKADFIVEDAVHPDERGLIVGSTSLHGAMHLGARLRYRNIILVGADCGMIDGHANELGYTSGDLTTSDPREWLARWDRHLRDVKWWLVQKYGVNIYSLNPFVNLNLEGHTWEGVRR